MKIKKFRIFNFYSIEDLELELKTESIFKKFSFVR